MTRNRTRFDQVTSNHQQRFSFRNRPSTEGEARIKLEELGKEATLIETELDHADPDTFASDEEYASWRNRATRALSHRKVEIGFLDEWLEEQQHERDTFVTNLEGPSNRQLRRGSIDSIANSIEGQCIEQARRFRDSYNPTFSKTALPKSIGDAHMRIAELTDVKKRIEVAFTEVAAEWARYPLKQSDLPRIKSPLQKVLSDVEAEFALVRAFIRSRPVNVDRWKHLCVRALSRAAAAGFSLTVEEREALEGLEGKMTAIVG